jgi:hypothetical protein
MALRQLCRESYRMAGNPFRKAWMKKLPLVLMALIALVVAPRMAAAQKLEAGKWSGSVVAPGGDRVETTYDVTVKGDTIGISVNAGEHGTFAFNDVKLADNTLTFWFQPGPRVDCKLARSDDGAFAGSCTDTSGGVAQMVMSPPKKE